MIISDRKYQLLKDIRKGIKGGVESTLYFKHKRDLRLHRFLRAVPEIPKEDLVLRSNEELYRKYGKDLSVYTSRRAGREPIIFDAYERMVMIHFQFNGISYGFQFHLQNGRRVLTFGPDDEDIFSFLTGDELFYWLFKFSLGEGVWLNKTGDGKWTTEYLFQKA